jgi:proteasome alpha subunit
MTMQFYVSPEQQMKDRADFARKGIARGRAVVVMRYSGGICFVAENPSATLHKISELYDRIGFAAVGRYNEFEALRIAGIQQADVRGYTYDRSDVTGRSLANSYAQVMGGVFASVAEKPFEVELVVAEVGITPEADQIFRISYDGTVSDESGYTAVGGHAESISGRLAESFEPTADLSTAVRTAVAALAGEPGPAVTELEVACLDRTRAQGRKFVRLSDQRIRELLGASS